MNPNTDGQQPSWRLWGEEKAAGAIYTVYLKKVRYHPCSSVSFEDAEDSISHLEWETVRIRIVKAGTLERLVESLANDSGELESAYINIFLSTYRSFATTQQVLALIIERFKLLNTNKVDMADEMKELHRKTLVQALMVWLDMHPEDFYEPPQFLALHQVLDFANQYMPRSMLYTRANHKLEKYHKEESSKAAIFLSSSPETAWFSRHLDCDDYDFLTSPPYEFQEIDERHFAYQLTWMDAELFKRLIPHHCLGSMWSRRDKPKVWNGSTATVDSLYGPPFTNSSPNTVSATVNQFNAVSCRVISTILSGLELDPLDRAVVITKWIDVAQELRFVKNFSSLKAITAALQSNAIYRLEKVWNTVPREKVEVFSELARIFSEENNQLNCRKLLVKEGSAKFAESVGEDDIQLQKLMQRQLTNPALCTVQGTVPYLGTFLTDLTMIDTAIPDLLPDGLINFDKRRKEFEVLAQIQLLQSSAKNYGFEPDPRFLAWFNAVNILDDNESYELSCLIEPPSLTKKPTILHKSRSVENHLGHRKTNSTSSTSTTSSSQFYEVVGGSDLSTASSNASALSPNSNGTTPTHNTMTSSSGALNGISDLRGSMLRMNLSLPSLVNYVPPTPPTTPGTPEINVTNVPEFYIIRVSIEQTDKNAQQGLNVYKSIMLSDRDHTRTVIHNAMLKHCISGSPDQFTLSQLLPNGEISFPSSANVYYAINTSFDLNFILRLRPDDATPLIGSKKSKIGVPLVRRLLSSANGNGSPVT